MYFLVQSNLHSNPEYGEIFQVLEELQVPYGTIELNNTTQLPDLADKGETIFVYGSVRLAQLAKEQKTWYPGSFYGGNHRVEVYAPFFEGHLLNESLRVFPFGDMPQWKQGEQLFIKPFREAKLFTGKVFTEQKWCDFVAETLNTNTHPFLKADTLVQASEVRKMYKEARLWIVGGEIVEAAYYRYHGDVPFETRVNPEGLSFAKEMIRRFTVAEAYVMDICETDKGWKIVEMNCINSAGFYPNVDKGKIVRSLVDYFGTK